MSETNFDYTRTEHYRLSLHVGTDAFTYALYDRGSSPAFHRESYPTDRQRSLTANLKTIGKDCPLTGHAFRSVCILLADAPCVAVPQEMFEEGRAESLYYGCMPRVNNQTVLHHVMPQSELVLLYAVDRTFCQLLLEHHPGAQVQASAIPVMEFLHRRSRTGENRKMYVHFHARRMDVYAFEPGKFLLTNSFRCTHGSDVLYFLLYIWQQLGFDQQKDGLFLIGPVPEQEQTLQELRRFVAQVSPIHPSAEFHRAEYAKADLEFDLQASFWEEMQV